MLVASLVAMMGAGSFGPSVSLADLPPAARATLERQAHGRPIVAVGTRAGRDGELVYEGVVAGERADVQLAVDARGTLVARFIWPRARDLDERGPLR